MSDSETLTVEAVGFWLRMTDQGTLTMGEAYRCITALADAYSVVLADLTDAHAALAEIAASHKASNIMRGEYGYVCCGCDYTWPCRTFSVARSRLSGVSVSDPAGTE